MVIMSEAIEGMCRPCVDCGARMPVFASRQRCPACQEAESDRVIAAWCEPVSASAAEVRADIAGYAEDGCWDWSE